MSLKKDDCPVGSSSDDPLVEALIHDVDMSLVDRNLRMTPQERIEQLIELQHFAAVLAAAGRRLRNGT